MPHNCCCPTRSRRTNRSSSCRRGNTGLACTIQLPCMPSSSLRTSCENSWCRNRCPACIAITLTDNQTHSARCRSVWRGSTRLQRHIRHRRTKRLRRDSEYRGLENQRQRLGTRFRNSSNCRCRASHRRKRWRHHRSRTPIVLRCIRTHRRNRFDWARTRLDKQSNRDHRPNSRRRLPVRLGQRSSARRRSSSRRLGTFQRVEDLPSQPQSNASTAHLVQREQLRMTAVAVNTESQKSIAVRAGHTVPTS